MSLYDRIFRPRRYTLSDGTVVEEKRSRAPLVILILVLLLSCMGAFIDTSFTSLIADIVPMRIRGRYFSARQRMTMISGIVAGVVMSWLLDRFTADGSLAGYTLSLIHI